MYIPSAAGKVAVVAVAAAVAAVAAMPRKQTSQDFIRHMICTTVRSKKISMRI